MCLNISLFVISIRESWKKFLVITCTFLVRNIQSFALPYLLILIVFFSNQTTSEDVFSEDEWLVFVFLGLKEAR